MKILKIIGNILFWLLFGIVILSLIAFIIGTQFKQDNDVSFFGFRWYQILTDSMSPEIRSGDIVIVRMTKDINEGDIITFNPVKGKKNTYLTHRVAEKYRLNDETLYKTKGDANKHSDISPVSADQIIGKVVFKIPYLGNVITFVKQNLLLSIATAMSFILLIFLSIKLLKKNRSD